MSGLLLTTIFLPLLGAVLMWVVAPLGRNAVRNTALAVTLLTAVLAVSVCAQFPRDGQLPGGADLGQVTLEWVQVSVGGAPLEINLSLGLDGLGVWMFGLSGLLMITAVLVSWEAIADREPLFYGMLLLLEFGCLGVFAARDLLLFYVFFEFTLIPLFFLIGIWGSEERRYAAIKFFLFTLAGSVLTFLGLLALVIWNRGVAGGYRFEIAALAQGLAAQPLPTGWQLTIFAALFAGFAIKVPLFPLHTWLPLAHVQAPTAGSVILAGILLKIGVYGFLRFSVPLLPEATALCMPWLLALATAGIVYGALVALAQGDLKRLIAYSSVSHLGACLLGLFALNPLGVQGGVLQMVNHGLSTGGLFALVGMLYERYHTRQISALSGLAKRAPWLACAMVLFTFSSIGVPGLNGFPGEFFILCGMFQRAWTGAPAGMETLLLVLAVVAASGVVLGAWYMLWLVERVFFGPLKEPEEAAQHGVADMNWREFFALAPLVVLIFWIGLRPGDFLKPMEPTLRASYQAAAARVLEVRQSVEPRAELTPPPASAVETSEALARVR